MSLYHGTGHSYLACPRLLKIDRRHGDHPSKWPHCRSGQLCPIAHKHETLITHGGGHRVADFYWIPGARPLTEAEHPHCACGAALVWTDLDNLYAAEHLAP